MSWWEQTWEQVTTPQPVPSTTTVLLTAAGALVLLVVPTLWHLSRHLLTIVHEAAHGFVAVLSGRRLAGIRVHSDTSGLTVSVGRPTGPGMVATLAAGYPGPAVLGVGAAWLLAHGYAVGLLWALLVVLVLVLVQIRNWYGLWAVLVTAGVLVLVTGWSSASVQVAVAFVVTWFLLLGAPRAVLELAASRRGAGARGMSDADQLGRLTHLPGGLWVAVFLLLGVGALVLGGAWLIGVPLV